MALIPALLLIIWDIPFVAMFAQTTHPAVTLTIAVLLMFVLPFWIFSRAGKAKTASPRHAQRAAIGIVFLCDVLLPLPLMIAFGLLGWSTGLAPH